MQKNGNQGQCRGAVNALLNVLFPCPHHNTTFPLTPRTRTGRRVPTYVVCLDCGREFRYDWLAMRIGEPRPRPVAGARHPEGERG